MHVKGSPTTNANDNVDTIVKDAMSGLDAEYEALVAEHSGALV